MRWSEWTEPGRWCCKVRVMASRECDCHKHTKSSTFIIPDDVTTCFEILLLGPELVIGANLQLFSRTFERCVFPLECSLTVLRSSPVFTPTSFSGSLALYQFPFLYSGSRYPTIFTSLSFRSSGPTSYPPCFIPRSSRGPILVVVASDAGPNWFPRNVGGYGG